MKLKQFYTILFSEKTLLLIPYQNMYDIFSNTCIHY